MTERSFSILSFPVVAVLLAVLVLALLFLGKAWGLGTMTFYLLAIPVALAIAYLAWYRTLPYEPYTPRTVPPAARAARVVDDEPFEDPVEEADELEREHAIQDRASEPDDGSEEESGEAASPDDSRAS
ncbi:MAG TPA: hypothetical protein VEE83_02245 [Thermoplasmata archaeon]|nr:hypothetical protein [Thermoplasmata archaeon]